MLANGHARSGHNQRGDGGNIDRAGPVASRAARVDQLGPQVVGDGHGLGHLEHGPQHARELLGRLALAPQAEDERRHLRRAGRSLQDFPQSRGRLHRAQVVACRHPPEYRRPAPDVGQDHPGHAPARADRDLVGHGFGHPPKLLIRGPGARRFLRALSAVANVLLPSRKGRFRKGHHEHPGNRRWQQRRKGRRRPSRRHRDGPARDAGPCPTPDTRERGARRRPFGARPARGGPQLLGRGRARRRRGRDQPTGHDGGLGRGHG